jgi:hypothetical protein
LHREGDGERASEDVSPTRAADHGLVERVIEQGVVTDALVEPLVEPHEA